MPESAAGQINLTVGGRYYSETITSTGDSKGGTSPNLAAAKTATLTTRTDDNTGSLTGASDHGIATADKIDVYWDGGSRRYMTVGTVASLVIPVDLGAGDVLPAAATALTIMKVNVETHAFDGDDLRALGVNSPSYPATVVFRQADGTEIFAIELDGGGSYAWTSELGVANPLAGVDVGQITITHGGSVAASAVYVDYVRA